MSHAAALRDIRASMVVISEALQVLEGPKEPATLQSRPTTPPVDPSFLSSSADQLPPPPPAVPSEQKTGYTEDIFQNPIIIRNVKCIGKSEKHNGEPARHVRLPFNWTAWDEIHQVMTHEPWIPLSQISPDSAVCDKGDCGTLVMSRWMANKKKMVCRNV